KLFKPAPKPAPVAHGTEQSPVQETTKPIAVPFVPPADDTNWTLELAEVKIPETPAAGRINGHDFAFQRATLQGGTLTLRQGPTSLTIQMFARQGEDLGGKSITIETNRETSPRVTLRWKDDPQQTQTQSKNLRAGYALRLDFGPATNSRITGKIYLCTPDEA